METKELNVDGTIVRIIPECTKGVWTIPSQLQIESEDFDAFVDLDRDNLAKLIEMLLEVQAK